MRVAPGTICLSNSSHLPAMPYSKVANPVAFPPGRERLSMMPAPSGSAGGLLDRDVARTAVFSHIYTCKRMRHSSSAPPIVDCRTGSGLHARVCTRVAHIHNLHRRKPTERKVEIPI
jgi:hypothetical protein